MARYLKLAPLVFFLAACIVLLIGCGGGDPGANVAKAESLLDGGNSAEALTLADAAIASLADAPGQPEVLFRARMARCRALAKTSPQKAYDEFTALEKENAKLVDADATVAMVEPLKSTREGKVLAITLAGHGKERFADQAARFDAILEALANEAGLDDAATEKLKGLGYIGASKKKGDKPKDEPKDKNAPEDKPKEPKPKE